MARRIQRLPWNQLCVGHAILAGRVPRIKWGQKPWCFDDIMMQCASSELIAHAFTQMRQPPKSKCHIISSNLILPGKGNEKRAPQYRGRGIISQSTR